MKRKVKDFFLLCKMFVVEEIDKRNFYYTNKRNGKKKTNIDWQSPEEGNERSISDLLAR